MQYDPKVTHRLKRMEAQLRGILRMMEERQDCKDIITQLSAVHSEVDRTMGVIVTSNLMDCVVNAEGDEAQLNIVVQQAMDLVIKSR